MSINVLDYLEKSAAASPLKTAVTDDIKSYTYAQLLANSKHIGSALSKKLPINSPVIVYMEKGADTLCAFFGIVYAGGFYSLMNPELPKSRLKQTQTVLNSPVVITSDELKAEAEDVFSQSKIVTVRSLMNCEADEARLSDIRAEKIDADPLYINFTSGSTGTPKGIVVGHRSVIDFIDCFTELFHIGSDDVIANQAPFDFDVSVKDIYSAMKVGATLVIVPRKLFSAPVGLIDYLCEKKITTMIWAVSALCLISTFHGLDYKTPETVNKVLFSGEVMPCKHLRSWREHLPNAEFVNLYGPTEITCNCTYHILNKELDYADGIPIGKPFPNENVFLLNEQNVKITEAEAVGEICVRGTALALGYYSCPEQNSLHFVQNPLNSYYPETIYRTGDLGRFNENGELIFSGRKDFQIKYMGHRIELEEIERAMAAVDGVERCCCIFDEKKSKLKGYYIGTVERDELHTVMKASLPEFMIPGMLRKIEEMPLTKNGKIDRKELEKLVGGKRT